MTDFDHLDYFAACWRAHLALAAATRDQLAEPFDRLVRAATHTIGSGGKLIFFGNGGSAADAQHLATELVVRFKDDREAIPAIALTTDSSALTAIGNDLGFERVFERQLRALGRPGDLAIGITTSGRSTNVTLALRTARELDIAAAALCGRDGGALRDLADPLLIVPGDDTARIQEMHIALGQMLCGALERRLGLVP